MIVAKSLMLACGVSIIFSVQSAAHAQSWLNSPPPQMPASAIGVAPDAALAAVSVESAKIVLPPGNWSLAAEEVRSAPSSAGGTISDKMQQKIYYQLEQGRLSSIVAVSSNYGFNPNGWTVPGRCFRRDVAYVNNEGEYPSNFDCLQVNHLVLHAGGATSDTIWRKTYDRIRSETTLPEQMIMSLFDYLRPNRGAFVSVGVYLNPELAGFTSPSDAWADSPWQRLRLDQNHRAYIDSVVRWAESYRHLIQSAWNN